MPQSADIRSRSGARGLRGHRIERNPEAMLDHAAAFQPEVNPRSRSVPANDYRGPMSTEPSTFYPDLLAEGSLPARGIPSQTLSDDAGVELVLFAFASGEALSEHTSARPAIIHVLSGEADLTAGGEAHRAGPGSWLRLPAGLAHSVRARTPLVMALYLLPVGADDRGV